MHGGVTDLSSVMDKFGTSFALYEGEVNRLNPRSRKERMTVLNEVDMHDQGRVRAFKVLAYRFMSVWEFDETAKTQRIAS